MISFVKQLVKEFGEDKVGQLSAAFAYFTLFSIGPLLLVIVSVASLVFGQDAVNGTLASQLNDTLGAEAAKTLEQAIASSHKTNQNLLGLIVGVGSLLLGASGLFGQLQSSFNQIFKVQPDSRAGIKGLVARKLYGVGLLGVVSVVVVASIIVSTIITGLSAELQSRLGVPAITLELINFLTSAAVIGLLLGLLYKSLAEVLLPWRVALTAGLVIGIFFSVGKSILGFIIGNNGAASAYGAAAALITLLLWVFYFGQIVFLGAEGIKLYGQRRGITYTPKKSAVKQKNVKTLVKSSVTLRFIEAFQRGLNKKKD